LREKNEKPAGPVPTCRQRPTAKERQFKGKQMKFIKRLFPTSHLKSDCLLLAGVSILLVFGSGCAGTRQASLRVGITPDYPPLVFKYNGQVIGAEVDFGRALGGQLNRKVEFVSLRWEQLIPAVQNGNIDIIMSGMSITRARQLQIAFSDPYLTNQLRAIFSRSHAERFKSFADIQSEGVKIGVISGTTADLFVRTNCPQAERIELGSRQDVAYYLLQNPTIDVYIDDTFALAQILSQNEADLTFMREPLAENYLAWGMRADDTRFLQAVNAVLARWKTDGTLDQVLNRWIPYLKRYEMLRKNESPGTATQ
jgi:ABC-type amino acid transport substrate-binding protein